MATYRILFIAANPQRSLVQHIAGCDDETHAKQKLRSLFEVVVVKKVELIIKE